MITKISFITSFLEKNEYVLLLTKGYSSKSRIENILMGWPLIFFKRSLFVFTNKRVFHIPTAFDYSYRNSLAHIVYSRCKSISLKFGTLHVECPMCNQTDRYTGISRKEKKKIQALLQTIEFNSEKSRLPHKEHVCPQCGSGLVDGDSMCNNCRLVFRTRRKAILWTLFVPAGGYFYTRNVFLGIVNALMEVAAFGGVGIGIYRLIKGDKLGWTYMALSLCFLVIKKISTFIVSNQFIREFIPQQQIVKAAKAKD